MCSPAKRPSRWPAADGACGAADTMRRRAGIKDKTLSEAVNALYAYRRFCATNSSAGQLILPEALKLLPLYTLARPPPLCRCPPPLCRCPPPLCRCTPPLCRCTPPLCRCPLLLWPRPGFRKLSDSHQDRIRIASQSRRNRTIIVRMTRRTPLRPCAPAAGPDQEPRPPHGHLARRTRRLGRAPHIAAGLPGGAQPLPAAARRAHAAHAAHGRHCARDAQHHVRCLRCRRPLPRA